MMHAHMLIHVTCSQKKEKRKRKKLNAQICVRKKKSDHIHMYSLNLDAQTYTHSIASILYIVILGNLQSLQLCTGSLSQAKAEVKGKDDE